MYNDYRKYFYIILFYLYNFIFSNVFSIVFFYHNIQIFVCKNIITRKYNMFWYNYIYNKYNFCKHITVCIKLEIEKLIFTYDINSNQKLNFLKVKKIYIQ